MAEMRPCMGTTHYTELAGRNTTAQAAFRCGPSVTRFSVQAERCRVLMYQVIRLSEKLLKGFPPLFAAPWEGRVGCATGSPIFHGVECPEKKPVYNGGSDDRGCARLVLLFPLASQGLSLCDGSWKRWGWARSGEREEMGARVGRTAGSMPTFPN